MNAVGLGSQMLNGLPRLETKWWYTGIRYVVID